MTLLRCWGAEAVAKGRGASRRVKELAEGREETYLWVLQTVFFAQEELAGLVDALEGKRNNRDGSQWCKRPQLILLLVVREEEFPVWNSVSAFLTWFLSSRGLCCAEWNHTPRKFTERNSPARGSSGKEQGGGGKEGHPRRRVPSRCYPRVVPHAAELPRAVPPRGYGSRAVTRATQREQGPSPNVGKGLYL